MQHGSRRILPPLVHPWAIWSAEVRKEIYLHKHWEGSLSAVMQIAAAHFDGPSQKEWARLNARGISDAKGLIQDWIKSHRCTAVWDTEKDRLSLRAIPPKQKRNRLGPQAKQTADPSLQSLFEDDINGWPLQPPR